MDIDPNVLLCLVNVQQLGGTNVPLKQEILTKGLKKPLEEALKAELIRKEKIEQSVVGANGKSKKTKIEVVSLTQAGKESLHRQADPLVRDKLAGAHLQEWKATLESERQQLLTELRSNLPGASAKTNDLAKAVADIGKSLATLESKFTALEAKLPGSEKEALARKIDEAFANLFARLSAHSADVPTDPLPGSPAKFGALLKDAYERLCGLIDFQDRLVPLYRLFHQARHMGGEFTVAEFHAELQSLWDKRELELQSLNEVRSAVEPDKAIRRGELLYYFVLWR